MLFDKTKAMLIKCKMHPVGVPYVADRRQRWLRKIGVEIHCLVSPHMMPAIENHLQINNTTRMFKLLKQNLQKHPNQSWSAKRQQFIGSPFGPALFLAGSLTRNFSWRSEGKLPELPVQTKPTFASVLDSLDHRRTSQTRSGRSKQSKHNGVKDQPTLCKFKTAVAFDTTSCSCHQTRIPVSAETAASAGAGRFLCSSTWLRATVGFHGYRTIKPVGCLEEQSEDLNWIVSQSGKTFGTIILCL